MPVTAAAPSALSYASPVTAIVGMPLSALDPTVTGTVTTYSISPALPRGLSLDSTTGQISGTPVQSNSQSTYTIGASNRAGATSFGLILTVSPPAASAFTVNTQIVLDPSVPDAASATIVQVMSQLGLSTLNASIDIPIPPAGGDSLLLAVDAKNNIVLAALANSASTTLSAESTALALARLSFGLVPPGLTPSQVNAAIQSASGYPSLVAAVSQALSAGSAPGSSAEVLQDVVLVLSQAAPALASVAAESSKKAGGLHSQMKDVVVTPTATDPLPFTLVTFPLGLPAVQLNNDPSAAGVVDVINNSFLDWNAGSSAHPAVEVELPATTVLTALLGNATTVPGPPAEQLADESGLGFNITINQTLASRAANINDIMSRIATLALPAFVGKGCAQSVEGALISSGQLDTLAESATGDAFLAFLKSLGAADITQPLVTCFPDSVTQAEAKVVSAQFVGAIGKFFSAMDTALTFFDGVSAAAKIIATAFYWDQSFTIGVCETAGSPGYRIDNCDAKLTVTPNPVAMVAGAVLTPQLQAFDSANALTGLPSGLMFQSSENSIALAVPTSKQVQALSIGGPATITVTDPSTNVTGSYQIAVVQPKIAPATLGLSVGGTGTLSLVDPNGNAVVTTNLTVSWIADDPTRVSIQAIPNPSNLQYSSGSGSAAITGLRRGDTMITAKDSASGAILGTATVSVTVHYTGTFLPFYGLGLNSKSQVVGFNENVANAGLPAYPQFPVFAGILLSGGVPYAITAIGDLSTCGSDFGSDSSPIAIAEDGSILIYASQGETCLLKPAIANRVSDYSGISLPFYGLALNGAGQVVGVNVNIAKSSVAYPQFPVAAPILLSGGVPYSLAAITDFAGCGPDFAGGSGLAPISIGEDGSILMFAAKGETCLLTPVSPNSVSHYTGTHLPFWGTGVNGQGQVAGTNTSVPGFTAGYPQFPLASGILLDGAVPFSMAAITDFTGCGTDFAGGAGVGPIAIGEDGSILFYALQGETCLLTAH